MRNLLRALIAMPVLLSASCGGDSDNRRPAEPGEEFVLPYGETIDVGELTLKFVAVTEESRCPINSICVTAMPGNAQIQLAATSARQTGIVELNTAMDPGFAVFDGHVIELVSLDPLPAYPYPRPTAQTYRATLIVDLAVGIAAN